MKQSLISDGFHEVQRQELDKAWAKFFYDANVPFAVAKNCSVQGGCDENCCFQKTIRPTFLP